MDKTRDVRRVKTSRFSPANRQIFKQSGSDFKKFKREKVRRLSSVGRDCPDTPGCEEMASLQSDGEDEFHASTSKRFKQPKRFLDGCNSDCHASVPRKLRSAIKKRNRESVSPPIQESMKLNHTANGVEPLRKDRMKRSKLKQPEESEGFPGLSTVESISKDEEEVVETLFALAGMFSETDKTEKANSDSKLSNIKALASNATENSMPVLAVPEVEEDSKITFTSMASPSSKVKGSVGQIEEIQFANQRTEMELQSYIPNSVHPLISKSSAANESCSRSSPVPNCSELNLGAGLNQPMQDLNLPSDRNNEDAAFGIQTKLQTNIKENKSSALWRGLPSTGLHNSEMSGSPIKLFAAKLPTSFGNSSFMERSSASRNLDFVGKDSGSPIDAKKSWKKCTGHVYISRIIKVLQITEAKDSLLRQPTHLAKHEGSKQGTSSETDKLRVMKNGAFSDEGTACSGVEKNPNEVTNAILLHKRLLEDQQQASTASGSYASPKQSYDFLSLPAGRYGLEAKSVTGRLGNGPGPETSMQFHVPFVHSFAQDLTTMSISQPQNPILSTSFLNLSSAAGAAQKVHQLKLPPYLGNLVSGVSPPSMADIPKQQQQQWFWAAPDKPGEFAAAAHFPNFKNCRPESPCIMQYAQHISPKSLEELGPRYIPLMPLQQQQQQQFISNASLLPQTRMHAYNHHQLSSSYGGNGGVFRPDGAPSLQLLCNEHH